MNSPRYDISYVFFFFKKGKDDLNNLIINLMRTTIHIEFAFTFYFCFPSLAK